LGIRCSSILTMWPTHISLFLNVCMLKGPHPCTFYRSHHCT
jgi:hypothetical protein